MYSAKNIAWCGIHVNGVLDPYYFINETVRGADYHEILNTYVRSSRHSFPPNYMFQRDGAHMHTINVFRPRLDSLFTHSWIRKHGPYNWHARSPDLSLFHFHYEDLFRLNYLGLLRTM